MDIPKEILEDGTKVWYEVGDDIPEAPERKMIDRLGVPVHFTHFPAHQKSFYMLKSEDPYYTESVDVLLPGVGEVIGGSMRMTGYAELVDAFEQNGISTEHYSWYLDQRKYGSSESGGFGLGVERLVMSICDLDTIKDACLYPRLEGFINP